MKQDEIIEMARQANATEIGHKPPAFHFYMKDLEAFAKLVADEKVKGMVVMTPDEFKSVWDKAQQEEREACESIEYDLAKSPAMFATMAEYKAYKEGVQDYRTKIIARGQQ